MHTKAEMEEVIDICEKIESLWDRLKHLINEQPRCPICLEPSDGICDHCKADPRN